MQVRLIEEIVLSASIAIGVGVTLYVLTTLFDILRKSWEKDDKRKS